LDSSEIEVTPVRRNNKIRKRRVTTKLVAAKRVRFGSESEGYSQTSSADGTSDGESSLLRTLYNLNEGKMVCEKLRVLFF